MFRFALDFFAVVCCEMMGVLGVRSVAKMGKGFY